MWYPAKITEAATSEPITLDEVKAQGIVDHSDDDDLLGRLIKAARDHVEHYCGVAFGVVARWIILTVVAVVIGPALYGTAWRIS